MDKQDLACDIITVKNKFLAYMACGVLGRAGWPDHEHRITVTTMRR